MATTTSVFEPYANDAHTQFSRPATSRGSSRGQAAYVGPREELNFWQNLAPNSERIVEGFHGAQTQETFYEQGDGWMSHSMRSTRNRGMAPVPRWPNTLPWAFNKVAYAKESSGLHTRKQPRRTSYQEDPRRHGESTWMQGSTSEIGPGLGAVTRTSAPFMNAAGRVAATTGEYPDMRSRRKMPYTLDNRTFSEYVGAKDTGINGIEYLLLRNHHLLPNTDERPDEYAEHEERAPGRLGASRSGFLPGEGENGVDDILRQDAAALRLLST